MIVRKANLVLVVLIALCGSACLRAAEPSTSANEKKVKPPQPQKIELVKGKLALPVPGDWQRKQPRSRIVAFEFQVEAARSKAPAVPNNEIQPQPPKLEPGRMTIMSAGGGVQANIARWVAQFRTAEGKPLGDDQKKLEQKKVGNLTVHLIDLQGTFLDKPRGPFGPSVEKNDYRMLAAIVPTPGAGTWFIKYYGPTVSVDSQAKSFRSMIDGIQWQAEAQGAGANGTPPLAQPKK